jgi:transcriptional regulator with XRE-family HTH domain
MFWDRFFNLCEKNGKRPLNIVRELGIASGSITRWKNGSIPSGLSLQKIADYFDVSVDYLLGKEEKPAEIDELAEDVIVYHRDGKTVTKKFTKEQMDMLLTMIEAIPETKKNI